MISKTFQIIPSVGAKKEATIWESGIRTWDDFLFSKSVPTMRPETKSMADSVLLQAKELLKRRDCSELANITPKGEHWRLFREFSGGVKYLDIETDGLGSDCLVTVVTVHSKNRTVTLTEGIDLTPETLSDALSNTSMLVTFNGSCFDIPVLRNNFPEVKLDYPQFDLRFASRKIGYRGGLKALEIDMGIIRDEDIEGMDGADAVRLWNLWKRHGDKDSLEILTEYNRADTVNLETIAETVYNRLVREYAKYRW